MVWTMDSTKSTNGNEQQLLALYSYKSKHQDELSFKKGTIITLVSKVSNHSGWLVGKINDKVGLIPENYVRLMIGNDESRSQFGDQFKMIFDEPAEIKQIGKRLWNELSNELEMPKVKINLQEKYANPEQELLKLQDVMQQSASKALQMMDKLKERFGDLEKLLHHQTYLMQTFEDDLNAFYQCQDRTVNRPIRNEIEQAAETLLP